MAAMALGMVGRRLRYKRSHRGIIAMSVVEHTAEHEIGADWLGAMRGVADASFSCGLSEPGPGGNPPGFVLSRSVLGPRFGHV